MSTTYKEWRHLSASERVKHAIFRAFCKHPVVGQLVGAYQHVMADETEVKISDTLILRITDCPTACTDGKKIYYNENFVMNCSRDGLVFLVLHEVFHNILSHHVRTGKREGNRANIAMDGAINQILLGEFFGDNARGDEINSRFPAPDALQGGVDRPQLVKVYGCNAANVTDASFEEIYEEITMPPSQGNSKPGDGEPGEDLGHMISRALAKQGMEEEGKSVQEVVNDQVQKLMQVVQACKNIGKLPSTLIKMANELVEPQVDYRSVLRDFLSKEVGGEHSYAFPSRRQSCVPDYMILPGPGRMPGKGSFAVLFDTSGSIYGEKALIDEMMGEVFGIQRDTESDLIIFYADAAIQSIAHFDSSETVRDVAPDDERVVAKGGGGTDFTDVFTHIEKHGIQIDALIGFTDLAAVFPPKAPNYPVVWVTFENTKGPFGKTINIKRQRARQY